ncbi:MAG: outer membrane beta-barrel protein [Emticicia sp.]|nr:outer membrane beta-barrel protein [Emticicia sp.]
MESFEDNIEKEYHERFQDFEEMPDDAVWNKIQERIAPEPEKRPIVFWWNNYRSMGIAASVLLGLLVGGYFFSTYFDTTKPQSDKITKSTSVGEKKQTTKSTQLLSKNNTITNLESQPKTTTEQNNELLISSESDELKTAIASKTINKKGSKSNKVLDSETELASVKKNIENTGSVVSTPIETLVKEESLAKINAIFDSNPPILPEKQIIELASTNKEEAKNNINITKKSDDINAEKQIIITQELVFLTPKNTDIQLVSKVLNVPALPQSEPVFTFEEPRRERLVFIPPTEIYANVSPMLSYYVFSPNRADNFVVKDFNGSSDRLSFAAQLGVVYPLSKKIDIRTGLSFMAGKSNFSYGLTNNNQKVVKVIDELNIEVQPVNSINTEYRNWQYLELQSDLLYAIKKLHALSVGFRAGVQTSALNKPVFNGRIGYRISKPVNNRVALWLEPAVVISLSSQKSFDNHFLYRTTGFGLNMGVSLLRHN